MSGFANSLIGLTLGGYSISRMIARGGMGIVYEGVQESLGRRVAVKVLYPHLGEDESFRERFQREARAIAHLRHSNIVGVIDFGTDHGYHFMVMDLVDGHSLRDELARRHEQGRPFSTSESLQIISKIGAALTYAHSRGLIHRDVKPANVMLDQYGDVFLTDFGLVKLADAQNVTIAGMIVGTPEYMAPEQSAGIVDVTPAADQYSLAILSYQLLVGRVPFTAPTPVGVINKHISEPPPPPSSIVPTFPLAVEQVLMRGLAKDPADRYPSVEAFVRDLERVSRASIPPQQAVVAAPAPETIASHTPVGQMAPPPTDTAAETLHEPRHDPEQITQPTPVIPASMPDASASAATIGGAAASQSFSQAGAPGGASQAMTVPTPVAAGNAGSGGYGPPPTTFPPGGGSRGRSRAPIIAAVVALALLLLVGGIAAASLMGGGDDDPPATATQAVAVVDETPTEEPASATPTASATATATEPAATPTIGATPTDLPTQTPAAVTPTAIRRLIDTPTPFTINPITPTPSPTPAPLGEVTGPAAEVELRNYMSVPTWIELVGAGAFVVQPGEYVFKMLPAGTWNYIQSAEGYIPLEGEVTWVEGGRYFWEFYDTDEVEIVEIQNNLAVPMTLQFDGWGEVWLDAGARVTRAFPDGTYQYTFTAEGYPQYTDTVEMNGGARTSWPFSPPN